MIRILTYVLIVFALAAGFAWLADRPGDLVMTWQGMRYEVSLLVAAVAVTALIAAVMFVWWLVKTVFWSPVLIQRHFRARKRDRAYQSISTGMIAAGAGDAELARRMTKQAGKLLSADQEPLIRLLDAQAAVLERRNDDARKMFEDMSNDPETRLLGLRGLYLEAERLGEREAARHYALKAAELAPQLQWASNVAVSGKVLSGDFDGAIKLVDAHKSGKAEDKRRRAVLLTGKAMSLIDRDVSGAKAAAMEANRLAPELVPAAVTLAKALFKNNDLRKGSGVLEAAWKLDPHPEVAETYVHARVGDTVQDRLKRARKLCAINPHHPDAHLALARALLDAKELTEAQRETEAALTLRPSEAAYLLLADIAQAEGESQGKIKSFIAKAVRAEPDAAWTADGMVSSTWAPISPISGRLDAFEWKVPVGRLQPLIDHAPEDDTDELSPVIEIPAKPEPVAESIAQPVPPLTAIIEKSEPNVVDTFQSLPARSRGVATDNLPPPPDDPGVKPEFLNGKPKSRFRLF
jgi:HemY protein